MDGAGQEMTSPAPSGTTPDPMYWREAGARPAVVSVKSGDSAAQAPPIPPTHPPQPNPKGESGTSNLSGEIISTVSEGMLLTGHKALAPSGSPVAAEWWWDSAGRLISVSICEKKNGVRAVAHPVECTRH